MDWILEILSGEGIKDSGNPGGRGRGGVGVELEKSSAGVILTNSSGDSNLLFGDTSMLSDPENSRNISLTYFSPNIFRMIM